MTANRPQSPSRVRKTVGLLVGAAVIVACVIAVDAQWSELPALPATLAGYLKLMAQGVLANPVAEPQADYWSRAIELMLESLHMAWIGTLLGAIISFPLAFLAAENVSSKPVAFATRQLLNAIRAIPELIFAIAIMLPVFGLGPLAGAFALGIHSVGTLGKLTSEVIESADHGPMEAAQAAGAGPLAIVRSSVVPQVLPVAVAFWLYRFEINIRASAVLGVLGAGGIGSILGELFVRRQWDRIGITLVVIIVVTVVIDNLSARIRYRLIAPNLG